MGIESSVYDAGVAVTQSDNTNDPNGPFAALWVGVAGTIKITGADGVALATTAVAGLFPVRTLRVWSTGTAATGIIGLKATP